MASISGAPQLPPSLGILNPVVVPDLVRLGNKGDGGYVIPQSALRDMDALLSFGVSTDWSLEEDVFRAKDGLTIHAYDHTVGTEFFLRSISLGLIKFAAGRGSIRDLLHRFNIYLGYRRFFDSSARIHFRQRIFNRFDATFDVTLQEVFSRVNNKSNIFVKMDIEGGEYRVIDDLIQFHQRIGVMAIEFHDTWPLREVFLTKVKSILEHFEVVHIHGNNCGGLGDDGLPEIVEMTFVNKRLMSEVTAYRDKLPISGLDFPNSPLKSEYQLVFASYEVGLCKSAISPIPGSPAAG